jgi:beta-lactamase superfamily II metal-dependent hydrolase
VNGGESTTVLSDALGQRFSPFNRGLDWLVIASTLEQQVAALPKLVETIPPGRVLWSGGTDASYSATRLYEQLVDQEIPVTMALPHMTMDLGDNVRLEILSVSPRGVALLVSWDGFRALLPLGMNTDDLSDFDQGRTIGPVTVLLLADAGWAQTNPPEWIKNLSPQLSVLSVATDDSQGMPDQSVLDSLSGRELLRTDRNGWIRISTDGERMWVEVQKNR